VTTHSYVTSTSKNPQSKTRWKAYRLNHIFVTCPDLDRIYCSKCEEVETISLHRAHDLQVEDFLLKHGHENG